jgi:hypothetical protein
MPEAKAPRVPALAAWLTLPAHHVGLGLEGAGLDVGGAGGVLDAELEVGGVLAKDGEGGASLVEGALAGELDAEGGDAAEVAGALAGAGLGAFLLAVGAFELGVAGIGPGGVVGGLALGVGRVCGGGGADDGSGYSGKLHAGSRVGSRYLKRGMKDCGEATV